MEYQFVLMIRHVTILKINILTSSKLKERRHTLQEGEEKYVGLKTRDVLIFCCVGSLHHQDFS